MFIYCMLRTLEVSWLFVPLIAIVFFIIIIICIIIWTRENRNTTKPEVDIVQDDGLKNEDFHLVLYTSYSDTVSMSAAKFLMELLCNATRRVQKSKMAASK